MTVKIYLTITPYFPTLQEPWRCTFLSDQIHAIQRTGRYEVVVINPMVPSGYSIHGIKVIGFKQIIAGRWLCPPFFDKINVSRMWAAVKAAGLDISRVRVIHGHLISVAPYVLALGRKAESAIKLMQFHDADPYGMLLGAGCLARIKRLVYFMYYRKLAAKMDVFVSISQNVERVVKEAPHQTVFCSYEPMRRAMRQLRWFRPLSPVHSIVLNNGIDRRVFRPLKGQRLSPDFVIGCVATFRDLKDQISLLKAVCLLKNKIPNVRIRFVGQHHSGRMLEECKAFALENALSAEFLDSIPHENLDAFYSGLDLFVLPSYFEGFGCSYVESWACGTPFIGCVGQGIEDVIRAEDRNLWLCKQQSPEDLADKIYAFYRDRPRQVLCRSIDIDELIHEFISRIEDIGLNE